MAVVAGRLGVESGVVVTLAAGLAAAWLFERSFACQTKIDISRCGLRLGALMVLAVAVAVLVLVLVLMLGAQPMAGEWVRAGLCCLSLRSTMTRTFASTSWAC